MLTLQEIFDKVAVHLLKQNEKSRTGAGSCAYQGKGGLMCAVGCLIEPEHRSRFYEGAPISNARAGGGLKEALRKSAVDLDDPAVYELLERLQSLHDYSNPDVWCERLTVLAHSRGLEMPDLEQLK